MGVRAGRLIVLDTDTNVNGPCSFDPHHCVIETHVLLPMLLDWLASSIESK